MERDPREKVLTDEFLLGEIMHRIRSSKSYIRSSSVNRFWNETAKTRPILDLFISRNAQTFFAFVVEVQTFISRDTRLLLPIRDVVDETFLAMQAGLDEVSLQALQVVATDGAKVLYVVDRPGVAWLPIGYHTKSPFSQTAAFRYAGPLIPNIPKVPGQQSVNSLGQFGVFMRTSRTGSSPMAFFVKEVDSPFMCSYSGVRFNSDASVFVHVCVYQQEHWSRFVSEPLVPPPLATFQRTPYCVLVCKKLYMMYLVGFILCFDLDAKEFSVIGLPGDMPNTARSWFDYTVSKGATGGLCLVHFHDSVIDRWVLVDQPAGVNWELDTTFNLVPAFGAIVQNLFRGVQLIDVAIDWGSVQLRSASQGCRYVFMSVGVNAGMFIADMLEKTLQVVPNIAHDGSLGRVFKLEENWPPKI